MLFAFLLRCYYLLCAQTPLLRTSTRTSVLPLSTCKWESVADLGTPHASISSTQTDMYWGKGTLCSVLLLAGLELYGDFVLADFLIETGLVSQVMGRSCALGLPRLLLPPLLDW